MKHIATKLLAVLMLGLASSTFAAAPDIKVGVLDIAEIIKSAPQRDDYMAELQNEFAPRKNEILELRQALEKQVEKLKRDKDILSASEATELENNIVKRQRNLERLQKNFKEDAAIRENEKMQALINEIGVLIDDFAEKESFDLLIRREAAPFYISDRVDATEDFAEYIKKTYKKGSQS